MRRWLMVLLVLACLLPWLITVNSAHAQSNPSRTITIKQNATGHMYFAPTYPTCVHGNVVQVKLINSSQQVARLLFNGGKPVSLKQTKSLTTNITVEEVAPGAYDFEVVLLEPRNDAYADVMAIMTRC